MYPDRRTRLDERRHPGRQLCALLNCRYPILQAGMGGVARSELVTAVTIAGGYGTLGMVRERPELISAEIDAVRGRTDRGFGVNVIPAATDRHLLEEQLAVCFEKQVHSLSLFWDVDDGVVGQIKSHGLLVVHQVGSVAQAKEAARAGADVIVAQGFEAGGHVHGGVTSLTLLPQVVRAVDVPVVAAGGFASGESLVAAWALGAAGIQCGTAFLATHESFAHDYHKQRVVAATEEDTVHTEVFAVNWPPHAPVRVLQNSVTQAKEDPMAAPPSPEPIAMDDGRPILRTSTDSPLRTTTGDLEALALYAGQVAGQLETLPSVQQRIDAILVAAEDTLDALQRENQPSGQCSGAKPLEGHPGETRAYASSPCYLHEFEEDPSEVDS
ncbi:MAG: nitronate monooxygenase [Polyangiales bacterium]